MKLKKHKKRVLYPWLKDDIGILYKTMLAVLAKKKGFSEVFSGKISYIDFIRDLINQTNNFFPKMYAKVSNYYAIHDRNLSREEFEIIVLGRFRMMFKYYKGLKKVKELHENPYKNIKKFGKHIKQCEKLIKNPTMFLKYYNNRGNKWLYSKQVIPYFLILMVSL